MKKMRFLLLLIWMGGFISAYAQQVSISDNGANPHPSAILDVQSVHKGMLIPQLTDSRMRNMDNPEEGLIVYNTAKKTLYYYDGHQWVVAPVDNLGNHRAERNLEMQGYWICNDDDDSGIYIASDGKVGIKQDDPRAMLDVHGDIRHGAHLLHDNGSETGKIWARFRPSDDGDMFLGGGGIMMVGAGESAGVLKDSLGGMHDQKILYFAADPSDAAPAIQMVTALDDDSNGKRFAMTIAGNGNVGVSTTAPEAKLNMILEAGNTEKNLRLEYNGNDAGTGADLESYRSRGTHDHPEALDPDYGIMAWGVKGYDGNSFNRSGWLRVRVDGPVSDGIVPARFEFDLMDTEGNGMENPPTPRVVIKNDGKVGIGTTQPQRILHISRLMRIEPSAAPADPQRGDIYFDKNDHKLKYYNGHNWVVFQ